MPTVSEIVDTLIEPTIPGSVAGRIATESDRTMVKLTTKEYQDRVSAGAEPVTLVDLRIRGKSLQYTLKHVFNYTNTGNAEPWYAASYTWIDDRTGRGFAHVDANRDTLPQLQQLRLHTVCLHRGRLVEA